MSGKFALIIGNTEYTDPGLAQLTAPGKDAEDFARVLKDTEIGAFDDVVVLLNQAEYVVREAIDDFFNQKMPDDLLVLYFSGHGVRDEIGALYLAVKNTVRSKLRATGIKSDYIREAMDQSRSRRQVLVLDCCNSGAFAQGTKAELGGSVGTKTAFEGGYGRVILTASDSTQFAWEGDKVIGETDNSLFTHYLVEGLEGEADIDGDGRITVDELYDYSYEKVRLATPKQTPSKFSNKQQGEIVLRHNLKSTGFIGGPFPAELNAAIGSSLAFMREGAIYELERFLNSNNSELAHAARLTLEKMENEDDSSRVANLASQSLERIRESEKAALQKAEEERLAHERTEAERKAKEEVGKLAHAQIVREAPEQEAARLKTEKEATEKALRKAAEKANQEKKGRKVVEQKTVRLNEGQRAARQKAESEAAHKVEQEAKELTLKRKVERQEFVYVIEDNGIPLYHFLPSSTNWTIWLPKDSKLSVIEPEESLSSIGVYGHYIEVTDQKGNQGYVTATAVSIERSEGRAAQ